MSELEKENPFKYIAKLLLGIIFSVTSLILFI